MGDSLIIWKPEHGSEKNLLGPIELYLHSIKRILHLNSFSVELSFDSDRISAGSLTEEWKNIVVGLEFEDQETKMKAIDKIYNVLQLHKLPYPDGPYNDATKMSRSKSIIRLKYDHEESLNYSSQSSDMSNFHLSPLDFKTVKKNESKLAAQISILSPDAKPKAPLSLNSSFPALSKTKNANSVESPKVAFKKEANSKAVTSINSEDDNFWSFQSPQASKQNTIADGLLSGKKIKVNARDQSTPIDKKKRKPFEIVSPSSSKKPPSKKNLPVKDKGPVQKPSHQSEDISPGSSSDSKAHNASTGRPQLTREERAKQRAMLRDEKAGEHAKVSPKKATVAKKPAQVRRKSLKKSTKKPAPAKSIISEPALKSSVVNSEGDRNGVVESVEQTKIERSELYNDDTTIKHSSKKESIQNNADQPLLPTKVSKAEDTSSDSEVAKVNQKEKLSVEKLDLSPNEAAEEKSKETLLNVTSGFVKGGPSNDNLNLQKSQKTEKSHPATATLEKNSEGEKRDLVIKQDLHLVFDQGAKEFESLHENIKTVKTVVQAGGDEKGNKGNNIGTIGNILGDTCYSSPTNHMSLGEISLRPASEMNKVSKHATIEENSDSFNLTEKQSSEIFTLEKVQKDEEMEEIVDGKIENGDRKQLVKATAVQKEEEEEEESFAIGSIDSNVSVHELEINYNNKSKKAGTTNNNNNNTTTTFDNSAGGITVDKDEFEKKQMLKETASKRKLNVNEGNSNEGSQKKIRKLNVSTSIQNSNEFFGNTSLQNHGMQRDYNDSSSLSSSSSSSSFMKKYNPTKLYSIKTPASKVFGKESFSTFSLMNLEENEGNDNSFVDGYQHQVESDIGRMWDGNNDQLRMKNIMGRSGPNENNGELDNIIESYGMMLNVLTQQLKKRIGMIQIELKATQEKFQLNFEREKVRVESQKQLFELARKTVENKHDEEINEMLNSLKNWAIKRVEKIK